jgi:hypothetical protein
MGFDTRRYGRPHLIIANTLGLQYYIRFVVASDMCGQHQHGGAHRSPGCVQQSAIRALLVSLVRLDRNLRGVRDDFVLRRTCRVSPRHWTLCAFAFSIAHLAFDNPWDLLALVQA